MRLGAWGELVPVKGFSRVRAALPEGQAAWVMHGGLLAVSSLIDAELPGSGEPPLVGPTWHISVSHRRDHAASTPEQPRCTVSDLDVLSVVDCFDLPAYDEDNHHPGVARHLFCPLDEQYRTACECKIAEVTRVEPGGYRWTTDPAKECRGCLYARMYGKPCTIHGSR